LLRDLSRATQPLITCGEIRRSPVINPRLRSANTRRTAGSGWLGAKENAGLRGTGEKSSDKDGFPPGPVGLYPTEPQHGNEK